VQLQQEYLINQWGLETVLQTDMDQVLQHTRSVVGYVLLLLGMRIVEQYIKDEIQRRMVRTIKHDLLQSVMQAPVNTFFDLVPVSKI
jgi:uncharacterized membrane protein